MSRHRRWAKRGALAVLAVAWVAYAAWTPGCAGAVDECEGPSCPGVDECSARGECSFERHCQFVDCADGRWVCAYDKQIGAYRWLLEGQGAAVDCAYVAPKCPHDGGCHDATPGCTTDGCDPCLGVTCDSPPACHVAPGRCSAGSCAYDPAAPGTACAGGGTCNAGGVCDAPGTDKCAGVSCDRPHTTGGTCVDGACQGFACVSGWGNCDSNWDDGCETALTTASNCGACGKQCSGADHASPTCKSGKCALACNAPWADCDGNAANGCEIPTGVANRCDRNGLNSSRGCGTAHCGAGNGSSMQQSFGSWHCTFCAHCHLWSDGYSWCLSSGGLFSSDRCASCCNPATEADLVCKP